MTIISSRLEPLDRASRDFYFCPMCWLFLRADLVVYWPPDPRPRCANCETVVESDV